MAGAQYTSGKEKLWQELRAPNPEEVHSRTGAEYKDGFYTISFLSREYRLNLERERIEGPEGDPLSSDPEFELMLLAYLLHALEIPPSGKWVSEKELSGGSTFFQGPHRLPADILERRFGKNLQAFRQVCTSLGGQEIPYGDAAFAFRPLPHIHLACVLYREDDEFPARVTFLFDSTMPIRLPPKASFAII